MHQVPGFEFEMNESTEGDTELLLSLLAEVEEQLAISRGCVHDASNKFEEGKEFEVMILGQAGTDIVDHLNPLQIAASERAKDSQLSETTRRKLQKRAQAMSMNTYISLIIYRSLSDRSALYFAWRFVRC
jgi:hypothetical protein